MRHHFFDATAVLIYVFLPEDLAEEADIYFNQALGGKPLKSAALFLRVVREGTRP